MGFFFFVHCARGPPPPPRVIPYAIGFLRGRPGAPASQDPIRSSIFVRAIGVGQNDGPILSIESYPPPANATKLRITVDSDSQITEANEGNNVLEVMLITQETTGEELAESDEEQVEQEIEQELAGEEEA